MALIYLILCLLSLFVMVKAVEKAIHYSSSLARSYHLSEFIISFFIVAVISVFPETAISLVSAFEGIPEFGFAALIGSNVADLTLVFGIVALFSPNGIRVKSEILKNSMIYIFLLALPITLGIDGGFSRLDGVILVAAGIFFYTTLSVESHIIKKALESRSGSSSTKKILLLIASLAVILASAYYTVEFAVKFADKLGVPAIFVSLTIVAIGSCLPELVFSLRAVKEKHDELALGDILGTVVTDATIILGIVALINPMVISPIMIYVTGLAMCIAGFLVVIFMRSGHVLSRKEGLALLLFYLLYLVAEFLANSAF